MTNPHLTPPNILQERQGLKLASYLTLATSELPHDISERLRVARQQAVSQRKPAVAHAASTVGAGGGTAALLWGTEDRLGWLGRAGALLPLVVLVAGLLFINAQQNDSRARELAEVDVALLTDELPPAAFTDQGFVQFLKADL